MNEDDIDEDEAFALSEKRDAEMESGEVTPLSHSELMSRLRKGDEDRG